MASKNFFEEKNQKKILYELEKKLGRHDKNAKLKQMRNQKSIKYFLIVTNMMYTLVGPIILMLAIYIFLKKFLFKKEQPIILIIFLFLGATSGYWSLIKQITGIHIDNKNMKEKGRKNGN